MQGSLVSLKGSGAGEGLRAFCLNIRRRGRSWDGGLCGDSWDGPAEEAAVVCSLPSVVLLGGEETSAGSLGSLGMCF